MNVAVGAIWRPSARSRDAVQLRVNVSQYGFAIAAVPKSKYNHYFLAEVFFKLAGVLLIPAGGVALYLPVILQTGLTNGALTWAMQFGLLAAFVVLGVALHRWANKGFLPRVQVDSARSEVRTGTVNIDGAFTLRATHAVSEIESFFILRSSNPVIPAKLNMRLKNGAQTIIVAEGNEASLLPILERITMTLRPPRMQNRNMRTKTTGRFIRMTFD